MFVRVRVGLSRTYGPWISDHDAIQSDFLDFVAFFLLVPIVFNDVQKLAQLLLHIVKPDHCIYAFKDARYRRVAFLGWLKANHVFDGDSWKLHAGEEKICFGVRNSLLSHLSNRPGVPEAFHFRGPVQATSGDSLRLVSTFIPPLFAFRRPDIAELFQIKVFEINGLEPRRHAGIESV